MDTYYASLTVWFEDPFWVGVYQREEAGRLTACRHVFGAEPREQEVYQWLLEEWSRLAFSPGVPGEERKRRRPKDRQAAPSGIGTKAQQALQLQREQRSTQRRERRKQRDAAEEARKFLLRQQKKKEKRRGH